MIVDCDVALDERPADLVPFCDPPWRRALEEPGHHHVPWSLRTQLFPRLGPPTPAADPARDPAGLAASLAARGVDAALLLPGHLLKLGAVYTADYAAAVTRAYNRWLVERWLGGQLYGALLAVPHDPEASARDIAAHASSPHIKAVVLPTSNVDPLWGDRRYDPIFAAVEAANLPVVLRGEPGHMIPGSVHLVTPFASEFDQEPIGQSLIALAHLNRIVGGGLLGRFPRLRLLFLGSGISWLMHATLRFDKEYLETRRDVPWFADRVSKTLRERVWVGTGPIEGGADPAALADVIRISCGVERVVYGSGWPRPHWDALARVESALPDPSARDRVFGANACDLLGLA